MEQFSIFKHFINTVAVFDRKACFIYLNDAGLYVLGHTEDEVVGESIEKFFPQKYVSMLERIAKTLENHEVYCYYDSFTLLDGKEYFYHLVYQPYQRPNGEKCVIVELKEVAEETEHATPLNQVLQNYKHTIEASHVGIANVSLDGRFISTNEALRSMLGYSKKEISGLTISEITHFEELPNDLALIQNMLEGKERTVDRISRLIRKDGSIIWVHIYASAYYNEADELQYLVGNIVDIDKEVWQHHRLVAHEQTLFDIQRLAQIGNWEFDVAKGTLVVSNEICKMLGIAFENAPVNYKALETYLHPDDEKKYEVAYYTAVEKSANEFNFTQRFILQNGDNVFVEVQGEILYDDKRQPRKVIGTAHDVTAYMLQQETLEESRQQFRDLVEEIGPMIMLYKHGGDGILSYVSPGIETIFGLKSSDALGVNLCEMVEWFSESLEEYKATLHNMKNGVITHAAYDISYKGIDGFPKTVRLIEHALTDEKGKICAVEGIAVDVSGKMGQTQTLTEYKHVLDATKDPISLIDTTFHYRIVNDAYCKNFNRPYEEIVGCHAKELLGADVFESKVRTRLERCFHGEEVRYQEWFSLPNGKSHYYDVYYTPYIDSSGKVDGALVSVRDITDLEMAKEALDETEKRLKLAGEAAYDLIYEWDVESNNLKWFADIDAALGFKKGTVSESLDSWLSLIHPDDVKRMGNAITEHKTSHKPIHYEYRIKNAKGEYRNWLDHALPLLTGENKPYKWVGVCNDITDRKKAEAALKKEKEFSDALFSFAGPLMVVLDRNGYIIRFNSAAERITGYSFSEVKEKTFWSVFLPEEEHEAVIEVFKQIQKGDLVERFENHWMIKDGTQRLFDWSNALVLDEDGEVDAIISVGFDITERKQMELAIASQEQLLRSVVDNIPQGIVMVDGALNVVAYNALAYELFGMASKTYAIGRSFETIIQDWAECTQQNEAMKKRAIKELYVKAPFVIEFPQQINNEYRWMLITHTPLSGGGFIRTFVDITERKALEMSYKETLDHLSIATHAGRIGTWDMDLKSGELKWDAMMFELFDVNPNDFSADYDAWVKVIHPEDLSYAEKKFKESIEKNTPFDIQFRTIGKEGDVLYFLTSAKVYYDEQGVATRMIGINVDISRTKEMEFELRRLNESLEERVSERTNALEKQTKQMRMLLDSLPLMVIYKDRNNTILDVNKPVADSLGVNVAHMRHKQMEEFFPKDAEKYYQDDLEVIQSKTPKVNQIERYETPLGTKWIDISRIPLFDEAENATGLIVILRDITQLRILEHEKESHEKMLVQQSKMAAMGEMIGAIAHQWRQPLNNMSVLKDLLADDYAFGELDDEKVKTFEKDMNVQLQYMSKTIDDFRNFFLPDKKIEVFNLVDVLKQTFKIVAAQLETHRIGVAFNTEHPAVMLEGYPNELMQVVLNIFNNAKDAINQNNIMQGFISIDILESETHVDLMVSDNGGGISEEVVDRVFDPYFTTKFQSKGTGLGLYMSKMLVERNMDGKLSVKNSDEGACFTITLKKLRNVSQ